MDKPVAAIEFASKCLKIVVGYELEGKIYVLYAFSKPYGHVIEAGNILDSSAIVRSVNDVKRFSDPYAKLTVSFTDALLVLPPYGLQVYQTSNVTTIVSDDGKIANLDIRNIYAIIKKNAAGHQFDELIDIIPERYTLDQGRVFVNPPIGETSNTLTIDSKIHMLPKRIVDNYQHALNGGGVLTKRASVAPFAACELLGTYDEVPDDYLLVDIGSHMTTVSFVGNKSLYCSYFFDWGGDRITDRIIERFNINESEAEKIKRTYGLDKREMSFKAPVCSTDDGNGHEIKHYTDELNAIIKQELDTFVRELNANIDKIFERYDSSMKNTPMILIGGGALLNGLKEYLEPKVPSDYVKVVLPQSLGARNPTYFNCLGMILVNSKYQGVYDEAHPRITPVTRDPGK